MIVVVVVVLVVFIIGNFDDCSSYSQLVKICTKFLREMMTVKICSKLVITKK